MRTHLITANLRRRRAYRAAAAHWLRLVGAPRWHTVQRVTHNLRRHTRTSPAFGLVVYVPPRSNRVFTYNPGKPL